MRAYVNGMPSYEGELRGAYVTYSFSTGKYLQNPVTWSIQFSSTTRSAWINGTFHLSARGEAGSSAMGGAHRFKDDREPPYHDVPSGSCRAHARLTRAAQPCTPAGRERTVDVPTSGAHVVR